MEAISPQFGETEVVEPSMSGVSWPAVLAGAAASCALTLVLLSFGAGMGFAVVSPWAGSGVSSTTFEIGTGLYFIVMAAWLFGMGGRVRLRRNGPCVPGQFTDRRGGFRCDKRRGQFRAIADGWLCRYAASFR